MDGGTEFKPIQSQFPELQFHISCPYTPEQNGLAERKHRHLVELALASMYHASIPMQYWDVIFESTLFVINRLPTVPNAMVSPFEVLFKQAPDYQFFHTLGCECFPLLRPYNHDKLQPRSDNCVFLGYSLLHKGYKCLHIESQRLYISRHVIFNETCFPFAQLATDTESTTVTTVPPVPHILEIIPTTPQPEPTLSTTALESSSAHSSSSNSTSTNSIPILPLDSTARTIVTRSCTNSLKPKRFPNHQLYNVTKYPLLTTTSELEPTCYTQASKLPHWRTAMAAELDALAKNKTWVLVDPPSNCNIIGCKWLYRIKKNADGSVERYKARLVAKEFTREEGLL